MWLRKLYWKIPAFKDTCNFEHIKTLQGPFWSRGYHHMFYTGRNDGLYVPAPDAREAAPYNGNTADFYQQLARDLKARGL